MAVVTASSDFGVQKVKSVTVSFVSPSIFHEVMGPDDPIHFFECWVLSQFFSLSSFTFIKRLLSSGYLRLLIFLWAILISVRASSRLAFHMMCSTHKLNKQGDNIQPWLTPFPIWNQSFVPCLVLTVASWSAYRFFMRQERLSDISISQRIFHSLLWFTLSKGGFPCSSVGKESACKAGGPGLIPRLGRSPGEGNGNPLQYSCLENPMDRGTWRATVHGVTRVGHNLVTKPPLPHRQRL